MVSNFFQGCFFWRHSIVTKKWVYKCFLLKRVNATYGLFDFHNIFWDVVIDWRTKEKDENVKNNDGFPEMYLPHVSLLQHASKIYTNNLYKVFENEYIKGEGYCQDLLSSSKTPYGTEHTYIVYENRFSKKFGFVVRFNLPDENITAIKSTVRLVFFAATIYVFLTFIMCLESSINIFWNDGLG